MGRMSEARSLGIGSSNVLFCLNRLLVPVASLRSLARSHPFWTKVSLPSGLTSVIVAWRSTFGLDERTHRLILPAPTTVVLLASRLVRYEIALPGGGDFQWY